MLVTLSESFTLSVYDLTHPRIPNLQVDINLCESRLPSTLERGRYRSHSNAALHAPTSAFTSPTRRPSSLLLSTHSTRAFDIPVGWVDEAKLRVVREQWGRKVGSVAGTQTDGRWVVLAPAVQGEVRPPGGFTPASLPLHLYRSPRWRWGGTEADFCAESVRADRAS